MTRKWKCFLSSILNFLVFLILRKRFFQFLIIFSFRSGRILNSNKTLFYNPSKLGFLFSFHYKIDLTCFYSVTTKYKILVQNKIFDKYHPFGGIFHHFIGWDRILSFLHDGKWIWDFVTWQHWEFCKSSGMEFIDLLFGKLLFEWFQMRGILPLSFT